MASTAAASASAFLGRPVGENGLKDEEGLPGRFEQRSSRELRDGAHNPAGAARLARTLGQVDAVLVVGVVADKDVDGVLRELSALGRTFVATASTSARALSAPELAALARNHFATVEAVPDARAALARGRELAGADGMVLVTGSLYLLADLHGVA